MGLRGGGRGAAGWARSGERGADGVDGRSRGMLGKASGGGCPEGAFRRWQAVARSGPGGEGISGGAGGA